ncbi:MAG TPA: apolipoprotein N-acyltransferase, partial [Methylomirabilota bacterium]|nr:apolipoprotein N-acyltransferase [Methylomirabilota bacterium]
MATGQRLSSVAERERGKTPDGLRLLIGAASGAALSLSFTGLYLSIYSWICVGVLLLAIIGARRHIAFECGFLHGLLFTLTSVPWIATVLTVHGGLSVLGGWAILFLIAIAWGVLIGAFALAVHQLSRKSVELACFGAPFLWVVFEFIRAHLPEISFPWNLLGYPASANLGLLQLTTITGIYGLSFLAVAFNALFVWAAVSPRLNLKKRITIAAGAVAILLGAMFVGPRLVPQAEAKHFARSVQPDFPEAPEYPPDWFQKNAAAMQELEKLSLAPSAQRPDLIVWPEAPAPFSFQDGEFAKIASNLAIHAGRPFLAGVIEWKAPVDPSDKVPPGRQVPYNSAILVDPQGQRVFVYDKVHLVPFGEYEPFPLIHQVVTSVSEEVGGFHKGNKYAVGQLPNGYKFGVF